MALKRLMKRSEDILGRRDGRCEDCENSECTDDCRDCLHASFFAPHATNYGCLYARAEYVLSYFFKFRKEIEVGLLEESKKIIKHLSLPKDINIVSLGCGPGTDLYGIIKFLISNDVCCKNISYFGVDINPKWRKTFALIATLSMQLLGVISI